MPDFDREVVITLLEEAAQMLCVHDSKLDGIAKERVELAAEKLGLIKTESSFKGEK